MPAMRTPPMTAAIRWTSAPACPRFGGEGCFDLRAEGGLEFELPLAFSPAAGLGEEETGSLSLKVGI